MKTSSPAEHKDTVPTGEAVVVGLCEALWTARVELAALTAFPDKPNFAAACPNPADADCVMRAYEAISDALKLARGES